MLDGFEDIYTSLTEKLIRDVASSTMKSDRKRLLDTFFNVIDTKANDIKSSKAYTLVKTTQSNLGKVPVEEIPLRELSPQKPEKHTHALRAMQVQVNHTLNLTASGQKGSGNGFSSNKKGTQKEEDKENSENTKVSAFSTFTNGRQGPAFREIQNASELSPEKRLMNRDRDAIGLSAHSNTKSSKKRAGHNKELRTPDKTNLENESPTKRTHHHSHYK